MDTNTARTGTVRSMVTFDDLTADLVWPRLLRAGVLSLQPARLLLAFVALALVLLVLWVLHTLQDALGWTGSPEAREHLAWLVQGVLRRAAADGRNAGERLVDLFFSVPIQFVRVQPLVALLGVPIVTLVLLVASGAIARTAATEFAAGRSEPMLPAVSFAVARWASLVGAVIGPIALVWFVALILAVGGFLLARWPGLNLVGAVLYGLALIAGLVATFVMLVYIVGKVMLVPSVCCDGADALDAIQRAYAYVLGRPLRYALYVMILLAEGAVLLVIVGILCAGVVAFTARATGRLAGEDGRRMVYAERQPPAPDPASERPVRDRLFDAGASIVRGWNAVPALIPGAFLLSYCACASTLLYLGMRRICDGQDMNEIWSPQEDRAEALGAGTAPSAMDDADSE